MTLPFPPELNGSGTNKHRLKTLLRRQLLASRSALTTEQQAMAALSIRDSVKSLPEWAAAKHIGIYWAFKHELSLTELIKDSDKNFYLPRITAKTMEFVLLADREQLSPGKFGIMEPKGIAYSNLDMIIVPAIGVHKNGQRLGYGKGYYDRYLKDFKGFKLCVAHACQTITQDIKEPWDIACDKVILA